MLPDGRVLRVTARPNDTGAVAFFFEDISRQVAVGRQLRAETKLNQCVLNSVSDAVAIFDPSGAAMLTNKSFTDLFGENCAKTLAKGCSPNTGEFAGFWPKLKAHASTSASELGWAQMLKANGKRKILAEISSLSGGATLAVFRENGLTKITDKALEVEKPDPIRLDYLARMLNERDILLDHSGLHLSWHTFEVPVRLRSVLWNLVIAAANDCSERGQVALSSEISGPTTTLVCRVSDMDRRVTEHQNVAANLLEQLTIRPDAQFGWVYGRTVDPLTVSYKQPNVVALSAV